MLAAEVRPAVTIAFLLKYICVCVAVHSMDEHMCT